MYRTPSFGLALTWGFLRQHRKNLGEQRTQRLASCPFQGERFPGTSTFVEGLEWRETALENAGMRRRRKLSRIIPADRPIEDLLPT